MSHQLHVWAQGGISGGDEPVGSAARVLYGCDQAARMLSKKRSTFCRTSVAL